jgi:serine/threonine protein kinase/WD40 repeat protein
VSLWNVAVKSGENYEIGEGGMGVVYKARDTRLDRLIAIKVLPADKISDPERKRRFVQEAKAASALNHPNIITIYDIGQADGIDFISMEYVAGKTLDRLIPRHGMGLNEALKCAVQVADALARAHAAGIIHRDIKPGNIMLDEHGLAKVLDFGLAKLTETTHAEDEATQTLKHSTEEGKIVGTVAYMSPEQAEGKKVDARTDIFSFGSVFYEMVTGQRAFQGDTKASTLATILKENPRPAGQLVNGLPREVERLISHCLRKEVNHRFQHMDDVRIVLQQLKEESDSGVLESATRKTKPRRRVLLALTVVALFIVALAAAWLLRSKAVEPLTSLVAVPLTSYPGSEGFPSFSPDGTQVAFSWDGAKQNNSNIYVKQIGVEPPFRLTSGPVDSSPAWSPDGRFIAFLRKLSTDKILIMLVAQRGGQERILDEVNVPAPQPYGPYLSWTPDSKWLVAPLPVSGQRVWALHLISTETGERRKLTNPPPEEIGDAAPAVSPDGRMLVFSRFSPDFYNVALWLLRLGKDFTPLGKEEKVQSRFITNVGAAWLPNGKEFVFSAGAGPTPFSLWRMEASSTATPRRVDVGASNVFSPTIPRQGNRLAFETETNDLNIWRIDLTGPDRKPSTPTQFIASTQGELYPAYSPDGKKIAFMSERGGSDEIWICDSDGTNAMQLTSLSRYGIYGPRWSWDGKNIAFTAVEKGMKEDLYVISASGGVPHRLTTDPAEDKWPYWSHDGKWIYFASTRTGREEIWRMPSSGGEAIQITRASGDIPQESPDGRSLYFMKGWPNAVTVWKASVDGGPETQVLDSVHSEGQFSVEKHGIYFFRIPDQQGRSDISLYDFATNRITKIATVSRSVSNHIAVSPDERTIIYPEFDQLGSDLMLVENFH